MKIPEGGPTYESIIRDRSTISADSDTVHYAREYNERYLHWSDLEYREFGKSDRMNVWALMKMMRNIGSTRIKVGDIGMMYNLPSEIQRVLHEIDVKISSGLIPSENFDEKRNLMLAVSSMMEESIASSQLEGASTTTKLAKKLLRNNSLPKDNSQQMIVNNYGAMQFIKSHLKDSLTPKMILELHSIISKNTLEEPSFEGKFRTDDSIAVRDAYEDVTYYTPIGYVDIERTIADLCDFINDDEPFVHPIVKGIILHFTMAYIHPFVDCNGRVSRSLFYWYLMKKGYPMVEYLSISKAIKSHRQKYDLAYLKTETDENDLTYFIQYNLDMIMEAIEVFSKYLDRKMNEQKQIIRGLSDYGLNFRQSEILKYMVKTGEPVSVQELASKYQSTTLTVRRDLVKLMECGLVDLSGKDGHKTLYIYNGKQ